MTTTERLPVQPPRLKLAELAPEAYKTMIRLDAATRHGLDPTLRQLVLIATITVINAWNRFAVTTRMVPGEYDPGKH